MNVEDERKLFEAIADIDKRVTVLETRANVNEEAMRHLSESITSTASNVATVKELLGDHVIQEEKDRAKFYFGIMLTLGTGLATLATVLIEHLLGAGGP